MQNEELQGQLRKLIDGVMNGKMSRREAIRRATILGISAPVAASLIRSGVASAQDATPDAMMDEVGGTIVVPEGLRTDLAGEEISVVLAEASSPDNAFLDAAHAKFTEATGIVVNRIPGEQSATDRLSAYNLQLGAGSSDIDVLQIDVIERTPAVLWRSAGGLSMLDAGGMHIAEVASRAAHPDLPLIAGEGADARVAEALDLISAAAPLGARLRGLVRMGERRWDVVLDRDQRILLPPDQPVQALERVLALDHAQDMLDRDVQVVDMRLAERPTLRMSALATQEWWHIRQINGTGR